MKFGLWSVLCLSLLFFACDDRCDDTDCPFGNNLYFQPLDSVGKALLTMPTIVFTIKIQS